MEMSGTSLSLVKEYNSTLLTHASWSALTLVSLLEVWWGYVKDGCCVLSGEDGLIFLFVPWLIALAASVPSTDIIEEGGPEMNHSQTEFKKKTTLSYTIYTYKQYILLWRQIFVDFLQSHYVMYKHYKLHYNNIYTCKNIFIQSDFQKKNKSVLSKSTILIMYNVRFSQIHCKNVQICK